MVEKCASMCTCSVPEFKAAILSVIISAQKFPTIITITSQDDTMVLRRGENVLVNLQNCDEMHIAAAEFKAAILSVTVNAQKFLTKTPGRCNSFTNARNKLHCAFLHRSINQKQILGPCTEKVHDFGKKNHSGIKAESHLAYYAHCWAKIHSHSFIKIL